MGFDTDSVDRVSRRHFLRGTAAVGALALVTACTPSAPAAPAAAPAAPPAPTGSAVQSVSGGAPPAGAAQGFLIPGTGAPKRGGTLNMALNNAAAEPPHWDPVLGGLLPWAGGYMHPYEYLLADRAQYFGDIEKVPGLAESVQASSDGLTYTFQIRKGVQFHNLPPVNGRELVADDVAWTFRHYAANSVLKGKYEVVDTVSVPHKYTVVFTLKNRYAPFLPVTLAHDFVILPHEVQEQFGDFKNNPIGTGPWMLDRHDRGSLISFKPHPAYWQMGADGKPLPYMTAYKVFTHPDQAGMNAAIRAGQVDYVAPGVGGLDLPTAQQLKKDRPDFVYWDGQLANFTGIEFNMRKAPWNNPKVRQAIALGINKDEMIAAADFGDPIRSGLIPVPLTDYAWSLDEIKQRYPFDKDQAIKQLRDLGVAAGMAIDLTQNSPPDLDAQVIGSQLTDLGFNVNIIPAPNVPTGMANVASGKFDLSFYIHSTSFEIDDWMSRYWSTNGGLNTWGYSNPDFDKICLQEQQELDPAKRKALVQQGHEILYQDMVAIPIASRPIHKMVNPRLKNVPMPHYQNERFTAIWIE